MEFAVAFLYVLIAALVWRASRGCIREDMRGVAAAFWPLTVVVWFALGLFLVPCLLLAFAGYLNTWWLDHRAGDRDPGGLPST
jgi:hypothetical protein